MFVVIVFGFAALALAAYHSGQQSGVDAQPRLPPPTPPPPSPKAIAAPKPGTIPPPTTPANILERKRLIVERGFKAAVASRIQTLIAQKKAETRQATINIIAKTFRARKIPLEKPNPALPFWALPETKIADLVATAANAAKKEQLQ